MLQPQSRVNIAVTCAWLKSLLCSASGQYKLLDVKEASRETTLCLAAAHALVRLDDGTIVGDPMEKTTLDALKWQLGKGQLTLTSNRGVR